MKVGFSETCTLEAVSGLRSSNSKYMITMITAMIYDVIWILVEFYFAVLIWRSTSCLCLFHTHSLRTPCFIYGCVVPSLHLFSFCFPTSVPCLLRSLFLFCSLCLCFVPDALWPCICCSPACVPLSFVLVCTLLLVFLFCLLDFTSPVLSVLLSAFCVAWILIFGQQHTLSKLTSCFSTWRCVCIWVLIVWKAVTTLLVCIWDLVLGLFKAKSG